MNSEQPNAGQHNVDDEKNHFDFLFHDETTVEDLRSLKHVDFGTQKPRSFKVGFDVENRNGYNIEWNDSLLEAVIDVFDHFKENDIMWEELNLGFAARDVPFTRRVLYTANELSLFKQIHLTQRDNFEEGENLCPGISLNKRLETLVMHQCYGGKNVSADDCLALGRLLQTSSSLKDLTLIGIDLYNHQGILRGFTGNKTLERVEINVSPMDSITDEEMSEFLRCFSLNRKLQIMSLWTKKQFGELTSQAIEKLLKESTTLNELCLDGATAEAGKKGWLNTECLLRGLKKNRSLKLLSIENVLYGDLLFSRLFRTLLDCPSLRALQLFETIATEDLEQVVQMERLPRPIRLILDRTAITDSLREITQLLYAHPEIRLYSNQDFSSESLKETYSFQEINAFFHILFFNFYGRHLIDRQAVPLSLWPLVLEKAKMKPKIIYEFLKGPAFAGRQD